MAHPLVEQLRFTRSEWKRALAGVSDEDARKRLPPMNCIGWTVGHLAWQEQRYWLTAMQGKVLLPELYEQFGWGRPATTQALSDVWPIWNTIVEAVDPFLDKFTDESLLSEVAFPDIGWKTSAGNLMQRVIYHYWYHTGECMAIRQMLGHANLPEFVGDIDTEAPFKRA